MVIESIPDNVLSILYERRNAVGRRATDHIAARSLELLEALGAVVWEGTADPIKFSWVSDDAQRLLGYPNERWLEARFFTRVLHPDDRRFVMARWREAVRATRPQMLECRLLDRDSRPVYVQITMRATGGESLGACELRGLIVDVTAAQARRVKELLGMQRQRLESLVRLSARVVAELQPRLDTVLRHTSTGALGAASSGVQAIRQAAEELNAMARQLDAFSARTPGPRWPLDLSELARRATDKLASALPGRATLRLRLERNLPKVDVDAEQIERAFVALVRNAAEAIHAEGGAITVITGEAVLDAGDEADVVPPEGLARGRYAWLEVSDEGCGMDATARSRMFEPFFTTKADARGLGLTEVIGAARSHRGAIFVSTRPHGGTRVRLAFRAGEATTEWPAKPASTRPSSEARTVLVVDDDPMVRLTLGRVLETLGFRVLEACDGREAIQLFTDHARHIAAVLLDMSTLVMDGEATFYEIRKIRSDVRVVLCSGYEDRDAVHGLIAQGRTAFLSKPYSSDQLEACLHTLLDPTRPRA